MPINDLQPCACQFRFGYYPSQGYQWPYYAPVPMQPMTTRNTTSVDDMSAEQTQAACERARQQGYDAGYGDGYNEGWNFPRKHANSREIAEAEEKAREEGYDDGYENGRKDEYEKHNMTDKDNWSNGYDKGWRDAVEAIMDKIGKMS